MSELSDFDIELRLLLEAIHLKYCYDFRHYAVASMRRRLPQALERFDCATLSQLQDRLLRDPRVFSALLQYLTVPVSEMFRDPPYWLALRKSVIPLLATYPSIRAWVAGCSTGEELYSLAILLQEEGLLSRSVLYATDINPKSLRTAEEGIYPLERVAEFSESYQKAGGKASLSDYYTAGYGGVLFDRALRGQVVFSDHSLATDGVFAEVQLISCRNVLIYFDRELQDRAVGLFRDALSRRGFLGIGSKESLQFSKHDGDFDVLVHDARIYRRRP